ncbi:MAG TPA: SRPBCC family protein [Gemmatimonadaceae bacterium]|nr:SRPBCC family protein [Gemmatimonadaceae bacterium]
MTLRASNALGSMPTTARMRTVDERLVRAPADRMFAIAADVERWPALLPHYRYVRFRERMHGTGVVEMSANRPFGFLHWPTWWVSLMEIQHLAGATQPVIRFRHIEGITRGMDVSWTFEPVTNGTRVTVLHLWNGPSWPIVGATAARVVIGPVFVHGIASRTLEGLARAAEGDQNSSPATGES